MELTSVELPGAELASSDRSSIIRLCSHKLSRERGCVMVERGGSDRGLTLVEPQEVAIDLARVQPFALGALQIRPAILEVAANGQHETLEPRVMQVLVALASQKDEVVSRDRLVQRCWSGRAVSEDAINRSIAKLRRLAENRGEFSIETIPRVGFRLTCPECATTPDPIATAEPQLRRRPRGRVILLICIAAVVALAALGRFVQHHQTPEGTPPTVALQPFTGLNGDPEAQASAASIAASLSTALSDAGIPIVSKPSQRGADPAASYSLRGSVWREGAVLKAEVRMEQPSTGLTVMSRTFDGPAAEAQRFPDEVSGKIAAALTPSLRLAVLERDARIQRDVLQAVLSEDLDQGVDIARRAAAQHPGSGLAQHVFAFLSALVLTDFRTPEIERRTMVGPARAAAARARVLLPHLGDAPVIECALNPSLSLQGCENELRNGIANDPQAPFASGVLAHQLMDAGRMAEALPLVASGRAINPFSGLKAGNLLFLLELAGRTDRPETAPLVAFGERYWRSDAPFIHNRFQGLIASGEIAEAERLLSDPVAGGIIEPQGREQPIREMFTALRTRSAADIAAARSECAPKWLPSDTAIATCLNGFALLGDLDFAFALAQRVYPERRFRTPEEAEERFMRTGLSYYSLAPLFGATAAPLRADRRFIGIAERSGLLDYWRASRPPDFCASESVSVCALLPRAGR